MVLEVLFLPNEPQKYDPMKRRHKYLSVLKTFSRIFFAAISRFSILVAESVFHDDDDEAEFRKTFLMLEICSHMPASLLASQSVSALETCFKR